jgi:DNA-directed RNA polymerase specialized sigma subunit
MKVEYTYRFANGDEATVKVDEELLRELIALDETEARNERRNTRRHLSLYRYPLDVEDCSAKDTCQGYNSADIRADLKLASLRRLLDDEQAELLYLMFSKGMRKAEIARLQKVSRSTVTRRMNRLFEILQKFFG